MFTKAQELELLQDEPQAGSASELRVVKSLLWDAIAASLNASERDEVRRVIGESRLSENEALFAEASALADILGEVQLNTKELLARHSLCRNVQRSMVESEVRMLMEQLRSLAAAAPFTGSAVRARDPDSVVPKAQAKDKSVFDYLSASSNLSLDGHRSPLARPTTASSLSRPTTSSSLSRPSTACSGGSNSQAFDASAIVSSMQDKLNVYEIDAVKDALRAAVEEEKTYLMEDIEYLTALLTDEADMRAQAVVPPPPLSDLKEYCLKLQSAVADEEARHEHELRVSQMFAAAAADSSKAARLRGMISASRRAQPQPLPQTHQHQHHHYHQQQQQQLQHQFAGELMSGGGEAASAALGTGPTNGVDHSSRQRCSKPWSGAEEASNDGPGTLQPQADVFVLEGSRDSRGAAVSGGGVGAAKRLANARGAVERTIPLLPPQPPPHSRAGSAGADAHSTDRSKSGAVERTIPLLPPQPPLHSRAGSTSADAKSIHRSQSGVPLGSVNHPGHSATLHPHSQETMGNGQAVIPQSHRRSHRARDAHDQTGCGSTEQQGTGLAGGVDNICPVTLQGKAGHREHEGGAALQGHLSMHRSTSLEQGAPTHQHTHSYQHNHSPQGPCSPSPQQGHGSSNAGREHRSPISEHASQQQQTHSPHGHYPPSLQQGHNGSSAVRDHRSPLGGHARPSSAARLRALVANPPLLPDASSSSGSNNSQGHTTPGHSATGIGAASVFCGAHRSRDSLRAQQSSTQVGALSSASQASREVAHQQGSLEHSSRSCEQDAGGQGADLDTKVDSLKGGVAAILRKHGLNPELTKSQTWQPQSAASLK